MSLRLRMLTEAGTVRPWLAILANVVVVALLTGFTITYVTLQQRKICGLVVLLDDRNATLPPADPDTMAFRRELHHYRTGLGC